MPILTKATEARKEIRRELAQRKKVYPRLISSGKLSRDNANKQYQKLESTLVVLDGMTQDQYRHFYRQGLKKQDQDSAQLDLV